MLPELSDRIRQRIEVLDQMSGGRGDDHLSVSIGQAIDRAPISAGDEAAGQLQQRLFALEASDAVKLGDKFERALITETGEMSPDDEVARDAVLAQETDQCAEPADI